MPTIIAVIIGYALGCVVTGYYLVRLRTGHDLRTLGSGKVGATNVGRVIGRRGTALTVLGDIGKGALAVGIAWGMDVGPIGAGAVACAVTAGHIWPVQLGLRGGRGAATAFGAVLVLTPPVAAVALAVSAATLAVTRRVTLAGIVAIAIAPAVALVLEGGAVAIGVLAMAVIVLSAHRDHLGRSHRAPASATGSASAGQPAVATTLPPGGGR